MRSFFYTFQSSRNCKEMLIKSSERMILFKTYTANIYLYSLKNDDTHIPNQQLCTRFVHSFFLCYARRHLGGAQRSTCVA